MEAASYASAPTNASSAEGPWADWGLTIEVGGGPAAPQLGGAVCGTRAELRPRRTHRSTSVGAEIRRRDALVAPERLGELGGLAVPDAVCDLAYRQRAGGQHLGRLLHPY